MLVGPEVSASTISPLSWSYISGITVLTIIVESKDASLEKGLRLESDIGSTGESGNGIVCLGEDGPGVGLSLTSILDGSVSSSS